MDGELVASYPAFPRLRFLSLIALRFKNLRHGKAGYKARELGGLIVSVCSHRRILRMVRTLPSAPAVLSLSRSSLTL